MKTLFLLLTAVALHGQTTINGGRTFLGPVDASGATSTRPAKLGTAAPSGTDCDAAGEEGAIYVRTGNPATVLTQVYVCTKTGASSWAWNPISHRVGATDPTTCDEGQLFYNTTSDTLRICTGPDTWAAISGTGGLGDTGGNGLVSRTALNTTVARTLTSSDSTISWANGNGVSANPDATINSALVLLRSTDQRGVNRYCASADGAGITYTCALSPTLNALDFVAGSTFIWNRSASCTSGTSLTLNIDGLGAKSVFAADGSTVLTTAECLAGRPLHLMYNGTHLRVIGGGAATGGVGDALVANPLSQFAPTSSLQMRNVVNDETGSSGGLVFAGSPAITTPTIAGMTATGTADFSGATALIAVRGTGAPSGTACDAAGEEGSIYVRTGDPGASVITQTYHCTKTGSSSWAWKPISHGIGSSDPTKCDEGQLFYNTTSDTLRMCTAADTWAAAGGGSSGTPTNTPYFPFGGMDVNAAIGASTALEVRFYEFDVYSPGKIVNDLVTATGPTGGDFAFALYSGDCTTMLAQTNTKTVANFDDDEVFNFTSQQTLTAGKYVLGIAERAGTGVLRRVFGYYLSSATRDGTNYPYFRVTGKDATWSSPNLTMPSSCTGTRVSLNAASPWALAPYIGLY